MTAAARSAFRPLRTHLGKLALVLAAAALAVPLVAERNLLAELDWRLEPGRGAGALVLFALSPLLLGAGYWLLLRALGVRSPFRDSLVVWTRSFLARYAPSGALAVALRLRERERVGATAAQVWTATAYEQLIALVSSALVCSGAFLAAGGRPPLAALAVFAVAFPATAAAERLLAAPPLRRALGRRRWGDVRLLAFRHLVALSAFYCLAWAAAGAATWLLLSSLAGPAAPTLAWATGLYCLGWLLAVLAPVSPAGFGLREAAMVALLAPAVGLGPAAALALAVRVANVAGELLAAAVAEIAVAAARSR